MERMKVSKGRKTKIRKWLEMGDGKIGTCPFYQELNNVNRNHSFCYSWFPKTREPDFCPCTVYPLAHVIRIAKIMLE